MTRTQRLMDRAPSSPRSTTASDASGLDPFGGFPRALVEATLSRVLDSRTFRRSSRHRSFIDHVVRATLDSHRERLKETSIGIAVFGRRAADFDPRNDPVVRVEAGRIRDKLARYYADEGAADPFEIAIPVGSYLPRMARRKATVGGPLVAVKLVVLPFGNLSAHADDAALSFGLVDQLIDALGRIDGLKVVSRISAYEARRHDLGPQGVGKLLGVTHVVEGSLQRSGQRLRCIAQLSRAKDGVRIWSERFEHRTDGDADVFAFQDHVADGVLAAVANLTPRAATRDAAFPSGASRPATTANRKARDLFERARYAAQQRSMEGYDKAIDLLERVVALDPDFGQAFSFLGITRANRCGLRFEPTQPVFEKIKREAHRALALDPHDGEAHALLATTAHRVDYDWKAAEPMFRIALRLAPSSTIVHTSYAWGLVFNGRFVEAVQHARTALTLDPLNLGLRASNALVHAYARDYATSIAEFHAVLELDATHLFSRVMLGVVYLSVGRHDLAMPHFEFVATTVPSHPSAHFCKICVYGLRGDIELGRRELAALLGRLRPDDYSRFNLAMAQACLGDRDGAFRSLEEAARMHDLLFVSLPAHVVFDRYRDDPAFVALLRRHGLDLLPPWAPIPADVVHVAHRETR